MKSFFALLLLCFITVIPFLGMSQDIIKTKKGEEIKGRILELNKKEIKFKQYDDPEFNSYSLTHKELDKVREEGKKEITFNHKLPRAYIQFGLGPSLPLGDFARKNYQGNSKNEPGFASLGMGFKLEGAFYIYRRLGLVLGINNSFIGFDYDKFGKLYAGGNNIDDIEAHPSDTSGDKGFNGWMVTTVSLGPIYSIKISDRLTWDIKARYGFNNVKRPNIFLTVHDINGYEYRYHWGNRERTHMGFNIGTAIRIRTGNRIALVFSADYYHSSGVMNISYRSWSTNPAFTEDFRDVESYYSVSALNFNFGIAYQFKRKHNKYE